VGLIELFAKKGFDRPPAPCPLQVGNLMQKLAEGRSERTTPIQGLKRALDIIVSDCQAAFARCGLPQHWCPLLLHIHCLSSYIYLCTASLAMPLWRCYSCDCAKMSL
jgi:hypothetical protein